MVLLTITPAMLEALSFLQEAGSNINIQEPSPGSLTTEPSLNNPSLGNPISHGQIMNLSEVCSELKVKQTGEQPKSQRVYSLENLLRGSRVHVQSATARPEPSSEYRALMARLRREEEARVYERMTDPLVQKESFAQRFPNSQHAHLFPNTQADLGEDDETTYNDINRQLGVIFNVIVSIVACSAAIWIVARHWSTPTRLGLSMGGSGLVGAAEVVVYAGYLRRVKEAKMKEKKAVEVKEVIDTWVIEGKVNRKEPKETLLASQEKAHPDSMRQRLPRSISS